MDRTSGSSIRGPRASAVSRRDFLRIASGVFGGAAAASILAACAPGAASAPAATSAPAAPASQPQAPTAAATGGQVIKIGAPFPLTGPWAENGNNSLHGVQFAVDAINAAGGIKSMGGAKLQVVSGDVQNDAALAASVTRKLIEVDKVAALIGCYLSSFTLTASTEAEKGKVPMITNSFVDNLTTRGYKYLFQPPAKASMMGTAAVTYLKAAADGAGVKLTKAANISSDDANSQAQARTIGDLAGKNGIQQLYLDFFTAGLTDASSIVNKVKSSGADVLFIGGPTPDEILIVRTLRAMGWNKPVIGSGGGGIPTPAFGEALKQAADGVFGIVAWNWDMPYSGMKELNTAYTAKFKDPFTPQESGETYAFVNMISDALEATKSADPTKIRDYLSSTTFDKVPASLMPGGAVKFDETGFNIKAVSLMIEWKGGLPHGVWPADIRAMPAFFG